MKKISLILITLMFTFACNERGASSGPQNNEKTRKPAVAGAFYPGDKATLEAQIEGFLKKVSISGSTGEPRALILPHAGYMYSGQVAAAGIKELEGKKIDTVVIIGNSHRARFEGVAVYPSGSFTTPLGAVKIDTELANALVKENKKILFSEPPHLEEHSLEVIVPFLQVVLKNLKIVPMLFGNTANDDYISIARTIAKNIKGKNVVVIASSDLSHYPNYKDAKLSDGRIIDAILSGSTTKLEKTVAEVEAMGLREEVTCACGLDAIKTVMLISQELGAKEIKLLSAANSGDVTKDLSRVVGYAAIGFFSEKKDTSKNETGLNKEEQKKLIEIAKQSVEATVKGTKPPALNEKLGAFVTLRMNGNLRGCIGRFSPTDIPLYQVVSQMAVSAAKDDPRFAPVSKEELPKIKYEVSVLSLLKRVKSADEIVLGRDGVKIMKSFRSGVFLPQVATETGWNKEEFLGELCQQKAGLPRDCWKDKDTELYTFTAQVFEEE